MLITELKAKETLAALTEGKKVFLINCVADVKKSISPKGKRRNWKKNWPPPDR